jgi:hypothetical protein
MREKYEIIQLYNASPARRQATMGVPGGVAEGAAAPPPPPVCWANKASRAIFASQSGNIGLL